MYEVTRWRGELNIRDEVFLKDQGLLDRPVAGKFLVEAFLLILRLFFVIFAFMSCTSCFVAAVTVGSYPRSCLAIEPYL